MVASLSHGPHRTWLISKSVTRLLLRPSTARPPGRRQGGRAPVLRATGSVSLRRKMKGKRKVMVTTRTRMRKRRKRKRRKRKMTMRETMMTGRRTRRTTMRTTTTTTQPIDRLN
jgi:hypothetical protein